jgi:cyclic beta-1,2-glucan synthetase
LWVVLATALQGRGTRAMQLLDMLNPILHSSDGQAIDQYRVEPFVVAADVYSQPPHVGRGGWTWYTGSAAWMYRVALESILGIDVQGNRLRINPCIPADWAEFELTVRRGETPWRIAVKNPKGLERGTSRVRVDGVPIAGGAIFLTDDGREHSVEIEIESV